MDDSMDFVPSGSGVSNSVSSNQMRHPPGVVLGSSPPEAQSTDYIDCRHPTEVLSNLDRFRAHSFMCDVEIEVEGSVFPAHRYVLAAAIPYFNSMFASDMRESRQQRIILNDLSASSFRQLLDFAYTSRVNINEDNVQQLLHTASILQMDAVCSACQSFLTQYLTTQNCLSIRQFAEQHNCTTLLSSVDDFAMQHFAELRKLPEFLLIPIGHLLDLLRSSDLKVNNEQEVFDTALEWVHKAEHERKVHLPLLLANVRLPQLPVPFFLNHVIKHPLIIESVRCRDLLGEAMGEMMRARLAPPVSSVVVNPTSSMIGGGFVPSGFHSQETCRAGTSASNVSAWANCRPRKSAAGVIFCVGGRGTSGDPFRSVEAYDWRCNRWLSIGDMNVRRRHVGVVSAQGKLYAIGGHDGTNHLDSAECFDPATNMWHTVASMDTHRRGIAVGALEGAIYAVGGLDDTACFQTVERYDIESDKWSPVASMNIQRGGVGVASLGKYLFAVGGNDGTSSLDSCERYDPLLNKWKMVANMQHRRAGAGVTVLDGCLYAIGGFDDNAPLPSCERYNPEENSWTLLSQMSCPRGGVGVAAMGGRIYAIGGHDGVRYLNSVEAYEPFNNQWAAVSGIGQCRKAAGACFAASIGEANRKDVCVLAESDLDQKAWDRNGPLRDCSICRTFAVGAIKAIMNTSFDDQKCIREEVSKAVAREADYCLKKKIPGFIGVPKIPDLEEKSYEHRGDVIDSVSDYILIQSRLSFCADRKPARATNTRKCLKKPFPGYLKEHCNALSKCDEEISGGCKSAVLQAREATCECVEETRADLKQKIASIADSIKSAVDGSSRGAPAIGSGSKVDTCVANIKGNMQTPVNDWVEVIDSALSKCIKNKAAVGGENMKKLGMDTLLNVGCRKVIADQTGTATKQLKAGFDFINNLIDAMVDRSGRFCAGVHCN